MALFVLSSNYRAGEVDDTGGATPETAAGSGPLDSNPWACKEQPPEISGISCEDNACSGIGGVGRHDGIDRARWSSACSPIRGVTQRTRMTGQRLISHGGTNAADRLVRRRV